MTAGDGLALGGFWPATFPLLRAENRSEQSYTWYEGNSQLSLLPFWQLYSGGMLGHGVQVAAQGGGLMAGNNSLA
jgi:hypothetical protein